MRTCALFAVLILASSLLATTPRLTTDKRSLPDAAERTLLVKMPILGTRLGALPEEVCTKLWDVDSDLQYVADARHQMADHGLDLDGYNYIGDGVAGAARTALDVENGRVKKILLFHPGMTDDAAAHLISKIAADAQARPVKVASGFVRFKMHGIAFLIRTVGSWKEEHESHQHVFMGQVVGSPAHSYSGPAAIEVCVSDLDWLITGESTDPKIVKAMQNEQLVVGMTTFEAYLAMRNHKLYRKHSGNIDHWSWTDKENVERDTVVTTDRLGGSTSTWYTSQEKVFATATFKDGVLESFQDETVLREPPK